MDASVLPLPLLLPLLAALPAGHDLLFLLPVPLLPCLPFLMSYQVEHHVRLDSILVFFSHQTADCPGIARPEITIIQEKNIEDPSECHR